MSIQKILNQRVNRPLPVDQLNEVGLTAVCIWDLTKPLMPGQQAPTRWFDDERCTAGALQVATSILAKQPDNFNVAQHRYTRRTGKEIVMFYVYDVNTLHGQDIQRAVNTFGSESLRSFTIGGNA